MNIKWMPTKDFTAGRGGKPIQYVIMHWGVVTNLSQIDTEVANPNREMSYTYALDKDVIHQYVSEDNTAWHAGVFDANQRSIGICIAAGPNYPYVDADYESSAQLIADIFRRRGRLEIKAHRDFKATECPGNLDFGRLRARVDEILAPAPPPPVVTPPVVTPPAPPVDPKDATIAELQGKLSVCESKPPVLIPVETTVYVDKDKPETLKELKTLKEDLEHRDELIQTQEDELATNEVIITGLKNRIKYLENNPSVIYTGNTDLPVVIKLNWFESLISKIIKFWKGN